MVNVSTKRLTEKDIKILSEQLLKLFSSLKTREAISSVLGELLTDSEKVMLAKRLVIIKMLYAGESQYKIRKILGASSETVNYWNEALLNGDLEAIESTFGRVTVKYKKPSTTKSTQIMGTIEGLLTLGGILPKYGDSVGTYNRRRVKMKRYSN